MVESTTSESESEPGLNLGRFLDKKLAIAFNTLGNLFVL